MLDALSAEDGTAAVYLWCAMNELKAEEKSRLGTSRVPKSLELYERAKALISGQTHLFGRRAEMHAYGISPIYSARQQGGYFWDVDGTLTSTWEPVRSCSATRIPVL